MLRSSHTDGVTTLTLARLERGNALGPDLVETLLAAVQAASNDDTVHTLLLRGEGPALLDLGRVPLLAGAQVLASSAMFSVFFRLQQVGGPTYLSQIGYVAAAIALVAGTSVLGERYAWTTWAGALVILAGIALSVLAEQRRMLTPTPAAPVAARSPDAG